MIPVRKIPAFVALSLVVSFGAVGCSGSNSPATPHVAISTSVAIHTVAEDRFLAAIVHDKAAGAGFASKTPESLLSLARLVGANFKDGLTEIQIEQIMAPVLSKTATETDLFAFIAATVGALYPEYLPSLVGATK